MTPGRHTRRPGRAGLRRVSVAALIMLVLQYGLGIVLNIYVAIPTADAHAGIFTEIATAPFALTLHAVLGVALIGTAILLVARAVGLRDQLLAVLASAGLTAIGGAFGAGEIFVRNGQDIASMAMALLTGVALLCYVGTLALASAAQREVALPVPQQEQPWVPQQEQPRVLRQAVRPRPRPPVPALSRARTAYRAAGPVTPAAGFPPARGYPAEEGWPAARPARSADSWLARE